MAAEVATEPLSKTMPTADRSARALTVTPPVSSSHPSVVSVRLPGSFLKAPCPDQVDRVWARHAVARGRAGRSSSTGVSSQGCLLRHQSRPRLGGGRRALRESAQRLLAVAPRGRLHRQALRAAGAVRVARARLRPDERGVPDDTRIE